jgi:anthranilate synthase/aminodeoxychorismate synthase-like glutamine amidotransferase
MRLLFIECQDSFSWNVVDRLPCPREQIRMVPASDARGVLGALREATAVVIGPGPLDPLRAGLMPYVLEAAGRGLPTLGICLGHQALGVAFGADLVRGEPRHGHRAQVAFGPSRLFPSFRGEQTVMRYHSLILRGVAAPLRVVASTEAGEVMAIEHEALPMAGLQFHPDSFGTPRGEEMLRDFFVSTGCI